MPMTDAQRRANRKWDAANYTHLPCKVRKERAAAFKAACYADGTSPNAVLSAAMEDYMAAHGGWEQWLDQTDST